MKNKSKKTIITIIASCILCLSLLLVIVNLFMNPYRGITSRYKTDSLPLYEMMTKEQAVEDIKFTVNIIKNRHYSAINGLTEEVNSQYLKEINNLTDPSSTVEVWRAVGRVLNKLNDAHSQVYSIGSMLQYVEAIYKVENGITYIEIGGKWLEVININGVKMKNIYANAKEETSYENEYFFNTLFEDRICYSVYLFYYGVEPKNEYTVKYLNEGEIESVKFQYIESVNTTTEQQKFVRYQIDKQENLAVLTLDACKYNETYKNTVNKFFREVKESNITNVAVDLRRNGGGNSLVANEFIKYLDTPSYQDFGGSIRFGIIHYEGNIKTRKNERHKDYLYKGSVYVLTSPFTFSSATNFSVLLQDNRLAKVIGEPSGNSPSAYGDVISFQLPNSKLGFQTTYKYFHRPDKTKDAEDEQIPDYFVPEEEALNELYRIVEE